MGMRLSHRRADTRAAARLDDATSREMKSSAPRRAGQLEAARQRCAAEGMRAGDAPATLRESCVRTLARCLHTVSKPAFMSIVWPEECLLELLQARSFCCLCWRVGHGTA